MDRQTPGNSIYRTEAYMERVFSVCGELTAGKRNRLTKGLEKRIFLKMNKKYYE